MRLVLRNALFTFIVPGAGGVYTPWWILTRGGSTPEAVALPASVLIVSGAVLYVGSVWMFAVVGRGTPGLWDAPRRIVVAGPYRWVRNPIYISALLIVVGEAWVFMSLPLLLYAGALAAGFHLLVVGYEEPSLRDRFGDEYGEYRRHVSRWIPRPPRHPRRGPRPDLSKIKTGNHDHEGKHGCLWATTAITAFELLAGGTPYASGYVNLW